MKPVSNLIIISFIVFLSCNIKKGKTNNNPIDQGITTVEINETAHDFGNVSAGEIVVYNFLVTNKGEKKLVINSVTSDCGCVAIKIPQKVLEQGQKGRIEVEFNSAGLFGKQLKTIEIDWNCKEPKQLVIFAEVVNENINLNNKIL
ncbi:MAG: hypothetical protein CSA36_00370 [Draconibacterium sp.]|nr:MAG: hypothetical protein CSA36_00370 [Draconibacterium sp.]